MDYLQPLKMALADSNLIKVCAYVNRNDPGAFSDHSHLLDHFCKELLPICDSARAYTFIICFYSDKKAGMNVIGPLLQMPSIYCCSNAQIRFHGLDKRVWNSSKFQIGFIENLGTADGDGINENVKERFLQIYSKKIKNSRELCDQLKKEGC